MTPRNALREINDQNERNRGTPSRLKSLLSVKTTKRESIGGRDEVRRWKKYILFFLLLFMLFGLGAYSYVNQLVFVLLM